MLGLALQSIPFTSKYTHASSQNSFMALVGQLFVKYNKTKKHDVFLKSNPKEIKEIHLIAHLASGNRVQNILFSWKFRCEQKL